MGVFDTTGAVRTAPPGRMHQSFPPPAVHLSSSHHPRRKRCQEPFFVSSSSHRLIYPPLLPLSFPPHQISREIVGHKKKVHSVAWNVTGRKLASGSVDQTARVWDVEHGVLSGKEIELKGRVGTHSLALTPGGCQLGY
jgi:WD40 repeat protein